MTTYISIVIGLSVFGNLASDVLHYTVADICWPVAQMPVIRLWYLTVCAIMKYAMWPIQ